MPGTHFEHTYMSGYPIYTTIQDLIYFTTRFGVEGPFQFFKDTTAFIRQI